MIRIKNIKTEIKENIDIYELASKKLKVNKDSLKKVIIHKKSIDARSKHMFSYVFDLDVEIDNENSFLKENIIKVENEEYVLPEIGKETLNKRPIVIGAGPAGLFCTFFLAKNGYKPVLFERGEKIEQRVKTVEDLWQNNNFVINSNVQFGEGGAGTFSDGKLNTLVKDKAGRMREVFKIFVECGAPEEILYDSKPHIGTDILRKVVINLREKIIAMGAEIHYNSCMEDIVIENGKIKSIKVSEKYYETDVLVLAIGHSARDTFKMLSSKKIYMEAKPFAVGIRIIHPQEIINKNQYPINYSFLPSASYKLTYKSKSGRGVYSFCMCPGGYVVNSRSTLNGICVNGMSNYKRDSGFANSAIVVTVSPEDYGSNPLDGISFQEDLEQKAYNFGNGVIPIQRYIDYKNNTISENIDIDAFKGKTHLANINDIFPAYLNESLKEGIDYFNNKINGFNGDASVIAAPEARTSSPVRIVRDEDYNSNVKGIYPCGEGAGYAGGITTSAMDGIKVFESIYKKYKYK